MLVLLILLAAIVVLAVTAPRYGVDSRPDFRDRNRRIGGRVSPPTRHHFN